MAADAYHRGTTFALASGQSPHAATSHKGALQQAATRATSPYFRWAIPQAGISLG